MALIRVQASEDMTWEEACRRGADLLEKNSEEFRRAVESEAERRYKSRHLTEFNKARGTIIDQSYKRGYDAGYKAARSAYETWHFCVVCGEKTTIKPNDNAHQAVIEFLHDNQWGHTACHEKV